MKKISFNFLTILLTSLFLVVFSTINATNAQTFNGSNNIEIGIKSSPSETGQHVAEAPFKYRYQYLSAGVNTGYGWATWNPNGDFAKNYIQKSIDLDTIPVFTYYNIFQSSPGNGMGEADGVKANLQNSSTMNAYFADIKLFLERAGEFPETKVILHVEPDMWGYIQQGSNGNATNYNVKVAASGHSDVSGYADNASGLAQAIIHLRDTYASNVELGFHESGWGTGEAIVYTDPSNEHVVELANKSISFYESLNADFDILFGGFRDRDAGFYDEIYGNPNSWMDEGDFNRHALFFGTMSEAISKPLIFWQIPLGDSNRSDSWGDYKDNIVEWLLDDPSQEHIKSYGNAGVVAFLFGGGADGVSGPESFFYSKVSEYYQSPVSLSVEGGVPLPPACEKTFSDVSCSNQFLNYIEALADDEIVGGYKDGTFGPINPVSRGQLATFVRRAFDLSANVDSSSFKDSIEGPHKNDILILVELGIVSGFSDNTFRVDTSVTREQVTKFMYKAIEEKGGTVYSNKPVFSDVHSNNKFIDFIGFIEAEGIMGGYSTGNRFGPGDNLTREQMAKVTDIARKKI